MNKTLKISLTLFAIVAGTLLLLAGAGTGPRYVGRFYGNGLGLSNAVDLVAGPNINITIGPGNRSFTVESTAAGAAGIFTNAIMGYGDEYRTNYVRVSPSGVSLTGGGSFAGNGTGLSNVTSSAVAAGVTNQWRIDATNAALSKVLSNIVDTLDGVDITGFATFDPDGTAAWQIERSANDLKITETVGGKEFTFLTSGTLSALQFLGAHSGDGAGLSNVVARFVSAAAVSNLVNLASNRYVGSFVGGGAGLTNLPGELNVKDFGAVGNGVTDDRVAIQKALDHAKTNSVKHGVFIPGGEYPISGVLNMDGSTSIGMYLRGEGPQVTTIRATTAGMTMINVAATASIVKSMITGITMDGDDLANTGIKLGSSGNNAVCAMDNMRFRSFTNAGVDLFKCTSSSIDRSIFVFCNKGIWAHHSGGDDYPTSTRFRNLHMTLNTNAFYASYFQTFSMDGSTLEGNYGPAIMIDPTVDSTQPDHFSFKDCHFEGNQVYYLSNAAVTLEGTTQYKMEAVTFDNCLFTGLGGATERLIYFGPGDYTMKNCSFATPKAGAIALTNSGYLNLKIESAANDVLPTTYFTNLGAYPNIRWDYNGSSTLGGGGGTPLPFTTYVNGGGGSLVAALSILGATNSADVATITSVGTVGAAGHILQDIGANIPTNAVPVGSASVTNWWLGAIGGIPTLVATNYAIGGWMQKALFP